MRNKKGFTLVELLAVIVILALIMSIAIVSIGGILNSARVSTFKETAAGIIDGVQKHLIVNNMLQPKDTTSYYTFTGDIVEKGGVDSPLGGQIKYKSDTANQGTGYVRVGQTPVYQITYDSTHVPSCAANKDSYVKVTYNSTSSKYEYKICLTAGTGNKFINEAEYTTLLGSDTSMVQ